MLSMITPPVCLATYAAAALAKSDFWQTGWAGMRLGIVAYVVPFIFAFHPALLFKGPAEEIVMAVITAVIGVIFLGVGTAGYLRRRIGWINRALLIGAGLLLIPSPSGPYWLAANIAGMAMGLIVFLWERSRASLRPVPIVRTSRALE
jgi:TRAP-type uncharacterized transport system fused permease subunit